MQGVLFKYSKQCNFHYDITILYDTTLIIIYDITVIGFITFWHGSPKGVSF